MPNTASHCTSPHRVEDRPTASTVETERLVERIVRADDEDKLDAITFSHGLGHFRSLANDGFPDARFCLLPERLQLTLI